ncbi:MAG: DUF4442 domain-containing protein, partial [Pseudomonadota bacterium]
LINLLDSHYIVWDKSAAIRFKVPAYEDVVAECVYSQDEVDGIREQVDQLGELEWVKTTQYTDRAGSKVFCEVEKTLYIATKAHYKAKKQQRAARKAET